MWDAVTARAVTPPLWAGGTLIGAALSADNQQIVTVNREGSVCVWELPPGPKAEAPRPGEESLLAEESTAALKTGPIRLPNGLTIEAARAPIAARLDPPNPGSRVIAQAAFSPDGSRVVIAGENGAVRLWDLSTRPPTPLPLYHDRTVRYAAFSPDGTRLALAEENHTVWVLEVATGQPLTPKLRHSGEVIRVFFRDHADRLDVLGADGSLTTWDLRPEDRSVDDLVNLARALAGSRIDEKQAVVPLEEADWRAAWEKLSSSL